VGATTVSCASAGAICVLAHGRTYCLLGASSTQ
jgi:hypothetical protein